MATIDSLDLATLTNNPQSIAEALEDVLQTTGGNIAQLKADAQTAKDSIDTLLTQAQTAKDSIDDLLTDSDTTQTYYSSTLDDSWIPWSTSNAISDEEGLRIFRWGKLYIMHISAYKDIGTGHYTAAIKTVSNTDILHPSAEVRLGLNTFTVSGDDDYISGIIYEPNGVVKVYGNNTVGNVAHVLGVYVGMDI